MNQCPLFNQSKWTHKNGSTWRPAQVAVHISKLISAKKKYMYQPTVCCLLPLKFVELALSRLQGRAVPVSSVGGGQVHNILYFVCTHWLSTRNCTLCQSSSHQIYFHLCCKLRTLGSSPPTILICLACTGSCWSLLFTTVDLLLVIVKWLHMKDWHHVATQKDCIYNFQHRCCLLSQHN